MRLLSPRWRAADPSPPPSPARGEGAGGCALGAVSRLLIRVGAWGLRPHRKGNPRAGGWARAARSAGSSGMGVWGAQPPAGDTRSPSRRRRVRRAGGGVGAQPPHERKSEGGWVGQSRAQRRLVRDGGVGGAAPRRRYALASRRRRVRRPGGGVGRSPHMKENPRVGGWARAARSVGSSGMGVWGAQPPAGDTRSPSRRRRVRRPGGGVGAQPPHERKSEGGWVGQSRA